MNKPLDVIKAGTSTVFRDGWIDLENIAYLAGKISERESDVAIVTSGATSAGAALEGVNRADYADDPAALDNCAALGQAFVMAAWRWGFAQYDTRIDVCEIHPINDTGINKPISAAILGRVAQGRKIVVNQIGAGGNNDWAAAFLAADASRYGHWPEVNLLNLTDVPGFYTDFDTSREAFIPGVHDASDVQNLLDNVAPGFNPNSVGGGDGKAFSLLHAAANGAAVFAASGRAHNVVERTLGCHQTGTRFEPWLSKI